MSVLSDFASSGSWRDRLSPLSALAYLAFASDGVVSCLMCESPARPSADIESAIRPPLRS